MALIQGIALSSRIDDLERALSGRLPEDVGLRFFAEPSDAMPYLATAEIAVGAPDMLAPLLPMMPDLRWLQSTWAGIEPFLASPHRGYTLTGLKGVFGRSMSEYVLGWMLAVERSIIHHASADHWERRVDRGLADLRLGIAGVGDIGAAVAVRCAPFVKEVVGLNRHGTPVTGCARCFANNAAGLLEFARDLDVLAVLLPATPATDHLIDGEVIAALRPGATLINAGRANALDLPAGLSALDGGHLNALVLDVLPLEPLPDNDPLWRVPGLYITSHTAAPTSLAAIAEVFLQNLQRYRLGETLTGEVDFARGY